MPHRCPFLKLRILVVLFVGLTFCADYASSETQVETFDDALPGGVWVTSGVFGGQDGSVVLRDGVCSFHKTGTSPASTQSIAMANAQTDHRVIPPWSVEYTIPDTTRLVSNGGYLCNRFWMLGAALYDWVCIRNTAGNITIAPSDGSQSLYSFPENITSLLKIRFDVSISGLTVYATTDIGSYGQGKTLKWQGTPGSSTPVGIDIMATDQFGATSVGPFDIAIDNLSMTTGALPGGVGVAAEGEADGPRFNPRCEAAEGKNLIANASFECGDEQWSSLGKPTAWGGDLSGLYGTIESAGAWDGKHCLKIDLGPGVTPVTCFDGWVPAYVLQHAPLTANLGWMTVKRDQPLTLSAYMRANVEGMKAKFLFQFAKSALGPIQRAEKEVVLSKEWARYTFTQTALAEDVCIAIGPDMTSMPDTSASFWMDAVQLEAGSDATTFETRAPVEIGISTGRYGNVYDYPKPVTFTVYGHNRDAKDSSISMKLDMEDYFGVALPSSALQVDIPAGQAVTIPWTIGVPGKGHFQAEIVWTSNSREHKRRFAFSVIQPYTHDDSPFGLNHPATTEGQLRLLSKAGLRWVRNWSINWDWVEPVQGQVSWVEQDKQFKYLASAGMKILPVFPNPSSNWASSAPASVESTMWYRLAYAPKDPALLFGFIGQAVSRYRDSCAYWEFLNEPLWVPNFCLPQSGGYKVSDYIKLLEGAYAAIKTADPNAKVIAGLAIEPRFPMGDEFIAQGGGKYCDIYNIHPYGGLTVPEDFIKDMERIQGVMKANAVEKPIWATETGYYGVDDKPWTPWVAPPGHFSAGLLLPNERVASDYLLRHAIIMLAHGTDKLFYHEPLDGPVNNGAMDIENTFLSMEAVPKKCYAGISALANLLGFSPKYAGQIKSSGKSYGYAFQCGDRAVLAVWAPKQKNESELLQWSVPKGVEVFDVMGNPVQGEKITISESPAYLQCTSLTAEALLAALQSP